MQSLALGVAPTRIASPGVTRADREFKNGDTKMYQNKAILIGFLGGDAEVRTGKNNQKFTTLSLATKTSYKDKESGEYISHTEWHRSHRLRQVRRVRGHAQEGRAHPDRGRDSPHRVHAQEGEEAGPHRLDSRQLHPQARPRGEGRCGRAGSRTRRLPFDEAAE